MTTNDIDAALRETMRLNGWTLQEAQTYAMVEAVLEVNGVPASLSWDGCAIVDVFIAEITAYGAQQYATGRKAALEEAPCYDDRLHDPYRDGGAYTCGNTIEASLEPASRLCPTCTVRAEAKEIPT